MEVMGVYQAKTNFSDIVDKVAQRGDAFTITRHGKPVARIVPVDGEPDAARQRTRNALADLKQFGAGRSLGGDGLGIRELIDAGRTR
jgi:prevent-host-death family protein